MSSGRWVAIGLLGVTVVAGVGLFYLQAFHYYERVDGVETITVGDDVVAVSDYQGLDNAALPLRLRGCFQVDDPSAVTAAGQPAQKPEPFGAPFWFSCWDPAAIDADLRAGRAEAVVAETSGEGDFATERVVVVYPDGRAFQWRRLKNSPS